MYDDDTEISDLIGETITKIESGDDYILFECASGNAYKMYHIQSCCESVAIEDIAGGELSDLVGCEILEAYESSNSENPKVHELSEDYSYADDSCTWTFYTVRTMKTTLTIRWYGSSNGYYSESVDFEKVKR